MQDTPQQWYVRTKDKAAGPFTSAMLREFAASGKITPQTLVRRKDTQWVKAGTVKGLFQDRGPSASHLVKPVAAPSQVTPFAEPPPIPPPPPEQLRPVRGQVVGTQRFGDPPYPSAPAIVAQTTSVVVQRQETNGLGTAGFITALLALFTCGLLSPVALLLSFIALFKSPRGYAIAGTVLGLIGSWWVAAFGFAIVLGILGIGAGSMEAAKKAAREVQEAQENLMVDATRSQIRLFQGPLEMYQMHMDALPSTQQGLAALRTKPAANNTRWNGPYLQRALPQDPWGNDYRYELVNAYQYRIWSLGQDGIDGTEDDIVGGPD